MENCRIDLIDVSCPKCYGQGHEDCSECNGKGTIPKCLQCGRKYGTDCIDKSKGQERCSSPLDEGDACPLVKVMPVIEIGELVCVLHSAGLSWNLSCDALTKSHIHGGQHFYLEFFATPEINHESYQCMPFIGSIIAKWMNDNGYEELYVAGKNQM